MSVVGVGGTVCVGPHVNGRRYAGGCVVSVARNASCSQTESRRGQQAGQKRVSAGLPIAGLQQPASSSTAPPLPLYASR